MPRQIPVLSLQKIKLMEKILLLKVEGREGTKKVVNKLYNQA